MHPAESLAVAAPQLAVADEKIVVITELVALANDGIAVVQVILNLVGVSVVCAQCVGINIMIGVSPEQILHCLVVHSFVRAAYYAHVKLLVLVDLIIEGGSERDGKRVVVLRLYVVHGVRILRVGLPVCIIKPVPVELPVGFRCRPEVVSRVPVGKTLRRAVGSVRLVPHVIVAARHVLPVARQRVFRVVVVQLRAFVHAVFPEQRRGQLRIVVDVPVPCQEGCRREVVNHARVTLFAVLVSPVRVVVPVVCEPVHLVCSGSLRSPFRRVAPCHQGQ